MKPRSILAGIVLAAVVIFGVWFVMRGEKAEAPTESADMPAEVENESSTSLPLGWKYVLVTAQGIDYAYPQPFQAKYVTPTQWPPSAEIVAHAYSCTPELPPATDGPYAEVEKRMVNGKEYCVATTAEGAAGSTFTTYEYTTDQGDRVVRVFFTLRTVQCANYDEPERSACMKDQREFDVDAMAHGIAESIRRN